MYRYLLIAWLLSFGGTLPAQDVEGFFTGIANRIAAKDYLRVNGRIGLRAAYNSFSSPDGSPRLSAPFTYGLTAGLNLDVLGINAPFTAAFANRNTTYNLPSYSFYGLSPTYRWITLHGGDRSMTFSPYSLSGVNFRGGGIELKPGKFHLAAMSGKLRRASASDLGSIQRLETAYRRIGRGLKVGYSGGQGSSLSASLFASADRLELNEADEIASAGGSPERNMVVTLSGAHKLSEFLNFSFETARSLLTRNDTISAGAAPNSGLRLLGLYEPNATTTASNALKLSVGLSPEFGQIQFAYERVDPEYRTHGSLFFQNDFENFTGSLSVPLFDKKLNLRTNAGLQRNDLDGQKASNLNRFIGAVNANYKFSDRVTSSASISNFTSTSRYKALTANPFIADSIVLAQTQFSVNGSTSFILDPNSTKILLVSASWQKADLIRDEQVDTSAASRFGLLLISYNYQPTGGAGTFGATLMANRNQTPVANITTLGPSVNYSRKIMKERGQLQAGGSYSRVWTNGSSTNGGVIQARIGGGFAISKQQSISLNTTLTRVGGAASFTDLQLSANYGYTFK